MEERFNSVNSFLQKYSPSQIITFLGIIFLVFILTGAGIAFLRSPSGDSTKDQEEQKAQRLNLAPYSVVYGVWSSTNSLIKSYDLDSGETYLLATLPTNIKRVTVLDNDRLLFIGNTDENDHGREISIYSIKDKTSTPILSSSDSFGIDEYVISPNKQYLSYWEVQTDANTGKLVGGKSRVYTINLADPSAKNLIFDEVSSPATPIHYPKAILDNGTLYTDTFLPNAGAGWAYGMNITNFNGSSKQDLSNMVNGTYGTQPMLSPNGKYLIFAGYDGKNGDGTRNVKGFRQSLVTPNTIELLDTTTNQRIKLPKLSNNNSYLSAEWSTDDKFTFTQISKDGTGLYEYDLSSNTIRTVTDPSDSSTVITRFDDNNYLTGSIDVSAAALGNLGELYAQPFTQLTYVSPDGKTPLTLDDSLIQYITTAPSSYFVNAQKGNIAANDKKNDRNLQLAAFTLKPSLAPKRVVQQSDHTYSPNESDNSTNETPSTGSSGCTVSGWVKDASGNCVDPAANLPKCADLQREQCGIATKDIQSGSADEEYLSCTNQYLHSNGACYDSPLYLYGKSGSKVSFSIGTRIFNANIDSSSPYHVTLNHNGSFYINDNLYNKLSFDYVPAKTFPPPTKGIISSAPTLPNTIGAVAAKLGLNKIETEDLLTYAEENIHSPYVFISFYDDATSKQILPITFDPKPDVYRNIVFYFKQLDQHPKYIPSPPKFEKIERKGFTAVEISGVVE